MQLPNKYEDVVCAAIDTYGREAQTDMCIEECSELIKALLKFRRLSEKEQVSEIGVKLLENIQEEIVDVQIMIWQMEIIYGYRRIPDRIERKIDRLRERVKEVGKPHQEASGH